MLYQKPALEAKRLLPEKLSNGDRNPVLISIKNHYRFSVNIEIIDELPFQFQKRDFYKEISIKGKSKDSFRYEVRPVERGTYSFGKLNCYVSSGIGLLSRRYSFEANKTVKTYPSIIQMEKYSFLTKDNRLVHPGIKKIRRLGHTLEFEQIKNYVPGDDIRTINWKATGKLRKLMVNQFRDERQQPVFSVIDSSRVMKMPFERLQLLDYAVNTSLAFSNIALARNDKTGLVTFSNKIDQFLLPDSRKTQLQSILDALYNLKTEYQDADYGLLQAVIQRRIPSRSLLLLFTNFEHISALHRQLPYLMAIARKHLLVVIFFENSELQAIVDSKAGTTAEITDQTVARQFIYDKKLMVQELNKRGIQTILTPPEDLTVNTINKYLEIKARALL